MSDEERQPDGDTTDFAQEGADVELDLLPEEGGEDYADAGDGLEIDDRQSEEIRRIFGTTLPQYLEPVEEMVEQILSAAPAQDTVDALLGTLSSLAQAASRVGFDEVVEQLSEFHRAVEQRGADLENPAGTETREALLGQLIDLKDLAAELSGAGSVRGDGEGSPTIVQALRGVEDLGDAVLGKLSAAGLTRVDQLQRARPDEIAAVSGLEPAVVSRLLEAVGVAARQPEQRGGTIQELPLGPQSLDKVLQQRLREQQEAQDALEQAKNEVQRLRARVSEKRDRLRATRHEHDLLDDQLRALAARRGERTARLSEVSALRGDLTRRSARVAESLRSREARLVELKLQRQQLTRQDAELGQEVEQLMSRVRDVLKRGAKRIDERSTARIRSGATADKSSR